MPDPHDLRDLAQRQSFVATRVDLVHEFVHERVVPLAGDEPLALPPRDPP